MNQNQINEDTLMSPSEVSKYLGMAERTIYQWATQEKMPAIKIGSNWRFRRSEIDAWLEDNHSGPSYVESSDGRKSVARKTKWKEEKTEKESRKALEAACSAYIMTTLEESTKSTFVLDLFNTNFGADVVTKTVNALHKNKQLKLNKKFKGDDGRIITVIERS